MELELDYITDKLMSYYEPNQWSSISDFFETLEFKYHKSAYHMEKIQEKIEQSTNFEMGDYYKNVYSPLYYELESFLVSIRSSIDIIMHLLNKTLGLNLSNYEVSLSNVYHSRTLSRDVKNVLHRYTHNRGNDTWNFIYKNRNQIVHEKSINQSFPLVIDVFQQEQPNAYIEVDGQQRNVVTFLKKAMQFLGRFIVHLFESVALTIEKKNRLEDI